MAEYILDFVSNNGLGALIGAVVTILFFLWYKDFIGVGSKSTQNAITNQSDLSETAINAGEAAVKSAIDTQTKFINVFLEKVLNNNNDHNTEIKQELKSIGKSVESIDNRVTALEEMHVQEQKQHNNKITTRINVYQKIIDILKQIGHNMDATRVFVFEFHNGSNNITGLPFLKFSMQYEWLKPGSGLHPAVQQFLSVPYSSIAPLVQRLFETKYCYVNKDYVTNYPEAYVALNFIQSRGALSALYIPLFTTDGQTVLGIMGIDFLSDHYSDWTDDDYEQIISNDVASAATLLDATNI